MSLQENWLKQQQRERGLEIDIEGYPVLSVYFYGDTPVNVITANIPKELINPRWNGKGWENGET